jgi:hypothetical protein
MRQTFTVHFSPVTHTSNASKQLWRRLIIEMLFSPFVCHKSEPGQALTKGNVFGTLTQTRLDESSSHREASNAGPKTFPSLSVSKPPWPIHPKHFEMVLNVVRIESEISSVRHATCEPKPTDACLRESARHLRCLGSSLRCTLARFPKRKTCAFCAWRWRHYHHTCKQGASACVVVSRNGIMNYFVTNYNHARTFITLPYRGGLHLWAWTAKMGQDSPHFDFLVSGLREMR